MGDLDFRGYSVEILPSEEKPISLYKHKDGRVVKLPSDPRSLKYYLSKGLKLYAGTPPPES